jgi:hypothetical protein
VAFEDGILTIVADDGRAMPPDLDTRLRPYLALLGARGVRVGAPPAASGGDERARRWQAAQGHPLVKEMIRRFEGDVIGREVATREEWLSRLERKP